MKYFLLLVTANFILPNIFSQNNEIEEEKNLNVTQLITKYNYPVEVHTVTTVDGYILELHRIPSSNQNKPPVFLQHGLLCSSIDWIITGPEHALGYILHDEGFDVWMGNARGNTYSRKHVHLNPDTSDEYWNFSWHEIGINDLTAMIDYVLEITNQKKLFYVGHSQGTTSFYVMCSMKPEYNSKILAHFSLAPIAYMKHITSLIVKTVSEIVGYGQFVQNIMFGKREFLINNSILKLISNEVCGSIITSQIMCENSFFLITGFDEKQINSTILPVILSHIPAGASVKQLLHYTQEIVSGYFRQYDYGNWKNKNIYGTQEPPNYELNKITTPIFLLWSKNDWLSAEEDVDKLYTELPINVNEKILIKDLEWNHLDYMWGIEAKNLVYDIVIEKIKNLLENN